MEEYPLVLVEFEARFCIEGLAATIWPPIDGLEALLAIAWAFEEGEPTDHRYSGHLSDADTPFVAVQSPLPLCGRALRRSKDGAQTRPHRNRLVRLRFHHSHFVSRTRDLLSLDDGSSVSPRKQYERPGLQEYIPLCMKTSKPEKADHAMWGCHITAPTPTPACNLAGPAEAAFRCPAVCLFRAAIW